MPCEDGSRDWNDMSLSQGMPGIIGNHQKTGERQVFPSEPPEGTNLQTPVFQTSDFLNCERINFCCIKQHSLWYFVTTMSGIQVIKLQR
jgi:hypothetical protein